MANKKSKGIHPLVDYGWFSMHFQILQTRRPTVNLKLTSGEKPIPPTSLLAGMTSALCRASPMTYLRASRKCGKKPFKPTLDTG